MAQKLAADGAVVRRINYLLEDESIEGSDDQSLIALSRDCRLNRPRRRTLTRVGGASAWPARDAFDLMWQAHASAEPGSFHSVPTGDIVPAGWVRYFPYPVLNPAQAQTVPEILNYDGNLVVVAPTGAGKTVIGMAAALRTILQQGRKSAWLVPQRSLTDELDRELQIWRQQGLRIERLSGEHTLDIERIRDANLWVATTEKFEAISRASSLREALADVGSLVVDEIHLLGDTARGPVLEALLARMRDNTIPARIVGLSATVSNGEEIAAWLRARLLRINWRPSRLSWQLPRIPAHADWNVTEAARTRLAAAITAEVTRDGGGVLVFCGSKRNVRRTALVIAASNGTDVYGVHPDDLERVHEVCQRAGVGLHYQGWEHRREAERAFRERTLDVLVATSTVAAGVNLPARAVVVRDTQVGLDTVDVATVQQMFGRAGRVGAGEDEGWAFMIVDEHERMAWQSKLVAGQTVRSQIQSSLPEHVLGEAIQQRISSVGEAEQWWVQTLANHQGSRSLRPVRQAVEFLIEAKMLTAPQGPERELIPTELGRLTGRLMISPTVGYELRAALTRAPFPTAPEQAEEVIINALSTLVPKLAQATVSEDAKPAVARLLAARGQLDTSHRSGPDQGAGVAAERGDLARATLLTVANSPGAVHPTVRSVAGVPYAAMYPVLEEAPRYLHWLGSQGLLGAVHPWCAIAAADLGRRIKWRRCQPPRGAGRLLWMCEQMATSVHADQAVLDLWTAATAREYSSPDWPAAGRPRGCQLDGPGYVALLRDRTTGCTIDIQHVQVTATGPAGAVLVTWAGSAYEVTPMHRGSASAPYPMGCNGEPGAAVFTWRGDYRCTGWLAAYCRMGSPATRSRA
jgi:helicase